MSIFFRRASNKIGYSVSKKRHSGKIFVILLIFIFAFILYIYNFVFIPILSKLGSARASQVGQYVVNQAISEVMDSDGKIVLISAEKDNNGKITSINPDIARINRLKSEIAITVSERLNDTTNSKIKVPMGNLSGISFFSNKGPKITFNLVPYGKTNVDFATSFSEAGINQTRHRVDVKVELNIALLLSNKAISSVKVETTVPISETIIVGDVPESYIKLETEEDEVKDTILNVLD